MVLLDAAFWERALATSLFGNSAAAWLQAAAVTALVLLAALLLKRLLRRRFGPPAAIAATTAPAGQELVHELMRSTRWALLVLPAVFLGALALALSPRAYAILRSFAILAVLLQVALWATVGVDTWVNRERRRRLVNDAGSATLIGALDFILRLLLWVLIALLALENLGVNVTALLAGLGVGGIAVALALQNLLGDILASLSIAADKPFVLGDTIQVDTLVGTVEDVGWRTTRLHSLSGEQLIFANSDLQKSRLRNLSRLVDRRVVLAVGVAYGTTADQLEKIPHLVRAAVEAQAAARFDRAHFKGFSPASLDLEAVFFLSDPDANLFMDVQQAILLALMRALEREGIRLAQPDNTVWIGGKPAPPTSPSPPSPPSPPTPPTPSPEQPGRPAVR